METGKELAEEHWSYTEKVLKLADCEDDIVEKLRVIYLESFIHGFKHGEQSCEQ